MANVVTGNPLSLDTTGTTSSLAWRGELKVRSMVFAEYAAGTDTAVVKDKAGRVVASFNGNADLEPVAIQDIGWIHGGLFLDSITAGRVLVYIE